MVVRHSGAYRWEGVPVQDYKEAGAGNLFKDITRQVLFEGSSDLPFQLRYFEVGPGGHSTLEHHEHAHLVFIQRGEADVLIRDKVHHVREQDVLMIPSNAWHQFQANYGVTMGFLCLVNVERDRPSLPTEEELNELKQRGEVAEFIKS